jgi:diguanylate cyclase (GGDEF)-like protein
MRSQVKRMQPEQILIAALVAKCEELKRQVNTDALTNALSQAALIAEWHKEKFCTVIAIDVVGLSAFNVDEGHDKGDLLLQKIAYDLKALFRLTDCVYRRGGDEFVVILPFCNYVDAEKTVNRIHELNYPLYVGHASGNGKVSDLIQQAFSQVENGKRLLKGEK